MNEWPKKCPVGKYLKHWYVEGGRTRQSVINDIAAQNLPGGQEASGAWFVWVNPDMTPAYNATQRQPQAQRQSTKAQDLAKKILESSGKMVAI